MYNLGYITCSFTSRLYSDPRGLNLPDSIPFLYKHDVNNSVGMPCACLDIEIWGSEITKYLYFYPQMPKNNATFRFLTGTYENCYLLSTYLFTNLLTILFCILIGQSFNCCTRVFRSFYRPNFCESPPYQVLCNSIE